MCATKSCPYEKEMRTQIYGKTYLTKLKIRYPSSFIICLDNAFPSFKERPDNPVEHINRNPPTYKIGQTFPLCQDLVCSSPGSLATILFEVFQFIASREFPQIVAWFDLSYPMSSKNLRIVKTFSPIITLISLRRYSISNLSDSRRRGRTLSTFI